jgi:rhodanese-related sulfurtransferase
MHPGDGPGVVELPPEEFASVFSAAGASASGDALQLVDVREEWEWKTARLPGFKLCPLSRFAEWCALLTATRAIGPRRALPLTQQHSCRGPTIGEELRKDEAVYVLCHHGVRSRNAANWLVSQGFQTVFNISGGIDAYALRVDSRVPQY